jgi:toxin ParE1/3/4
MASRRIDLHHGARDDLSEAVEGYLVRSDKAAAEFVEEIWQSLGRIVAAPLLYPRYKHGTRFRRLRRFPFLIVYWVADDLISVVAVQHERRRPRYWKWRLDDLAPP